LIIDGGSTDGSKEFISKKYSTLNYWQSKKDKGIYDAMNIGIQKSKGEYLFFLNSGDVLFNSEVLSSIEPLLNVDLIYGDIEEVSKDKKSIWKQPPLLSFRHFLINSLPHQATFIRRALFLQYGLYNEKLKICSDWAFFIDVICKYNASYKYVPFTISSFNTEGISSLVENLLLINEEKNTHLQENFAVFLDDYQSTIMMVAKYNALKNSRIRKILSVFFKSLKF